MAERRFPKLQAVGSTPSSPTINLDPSRAWRVGHPEKINRYHSVYVLEWYHSGLNHGPEEKTREGSPPPEAILSCRPFLLFESRP